MKQSDYPEQMGTLQIETERLVMRRFQAGDWADLYEYLSQPETVRFEPYEPFTEEAARREAVNRMENSDFWAVVRKSDQKLIGNLYFSKDIFFKKDADGNPIWQDTLLYGLLAGEWQLKENPLLPSFPAELTSRLFGYTCNKDRIGCSSAGVFRFEGNDDILYLKVTGVSDEIRRERDLSVWLKGKAPVPDVLYYEEQDGNAFLLMTRVDGFMACDCPRDAAGEQDKVHEPIEQTVRLLADALLMLQAVDIKECPFENTLDCKLKAALYNIEHDLVDMADFEESNDFDSPMELYRWLVENRPPEELCFTHGDFCLPNIFIDGKAVTGFIDVGRGGIADKWQDIALCVRSLGYNLRHTKQQKYIDLLFTYLGIQPDKAKIRYYILLDELF